MLKNNHDQEKKEKKLKSWFQQTEDAGLMSMAYQNTNDWNKTRKMIHIFKDY